MPLLREVLKILVKIGVKTNLQLYRKIDGILSDPLLDIRSKPEIKLITSILVNNKVLFRKLV